MNYPIRTYAVSIIVLGSLCGCSAVQPIASSIGGVVTRIVNPDRTSAPVAPSSPGLDAYKTQVAYHVMRHNPSQVFSGTLPPMLPAIVVVNVTVDKDGRLTDVKVQRARDPQAARVAVDSVRRSEPLPKPATLLAQGGNELMFSETFLFNDQYRFQLRSVAGPQPSGL